MIKMKVIIVSLMLVVLSPSFSFCGDMFILHNFIIQQNGMYPTLPVKSKLWIKKGLLFSLSDISRGDIVVHKEIANNKKYYTVWRAIGVPGDHIKITGTDIQINNTKLKRKIIKESNKEVLYIEKIDEAEYQVAYQKESGENPRIDIDLVVPRNHYYLMGDNRDNAYDSRFVGPVAADKIIGEKIN